MTCSPATCAMKGDQEKPKGSRVHRKVPMEVRIPKWARHEGARGMEKDMFLRSSGQWKADLAARRAMVAWDFMLNLGGALAAELSFLPLKTSRILPVLKEEVRDAEVGRPRLEERAHVGPFLGRS